MDLLSDPIVTRHSAPWYGLLSYIAYIQARRAGQQGQHDQSWFTRLLFGQLSMTLVAVILQLRFWQLLDNNLRSSVYDALATLGRPQSEAELLITDADAALIVPASGLKLFAGLGLLLGALTPPRTASCWAFNLTWTTLRLLALLSAFLSAGVSWREAWSTQPSAIQQPRWTRVPDASSASPLLIPLLTVGTELAEMLALIFFPSFSQAIELAFALFGGITLASIVTLLPRSSLATVSSAASALLLTRYFLPTVGILLSVLCLGTRRLAYLFAGAVAPPLLIDSDHPPLYRGQDWSLSRRLHFANAWGRERCLLMAIARLMRTMDSSQWLP